MDIFSEHKAQELVRTAVQQTIQGYNEWLLKDVGIRNKKTKKSLDKSAEFYLKKNAKGLTKRIHAKLKNKGIVITKIKK